MAVVFDSIEIGHEYTRTQLAELWGYVSYQAISRGLVTPRGDNKIILFITRERRSTDPAYENRLSNGLLEMDGPDDHFAEQRMLDADTNGDEVHLFYRDLHRSPFTYLGLLDLLDSTLRSDRPSRFRYRVRGR
jgi:putative restriction endonuclease